MSASAGPSAAVAPRPSALDALLAKRKQRQEAQMAAAAATEASHTDAAAATPVAPSTVHSYGGGDDAIRRLQSDLVALGRGGTSAEDSAAAQAAMARLEENVGTVAQIKALPSTVRADLFKTLLPCFLPPSSSSGGVSIRWREREECRRSAVALVRTAVAALPDMEEHGFLTKCIATLAVCVGTVDVSSAPKTLGANTTAHERSGANVTPLGDDVPSLPPQSQPTPSAPEPDAGSMDWLAKLQARAEAQLRVKGEQFMLREYLSLLRELIFYSSANRQCAPHLMVVCSMLYVALTTATDDDALLHTCDSLAQLAVDYSQLMPGWSRILLVPLLQRVLLHRKSQLRIGAIVAVSKLIPCGAAEMIRDLQGFRESNLIEIAEVYNPRGRRNFMGALVQDENSRVREAFMRMVCDWALHLPDRADYATLMMPYVLSGMADEAPAVRAVALAAMQQLGAVKREEEEQRLAGGIMGPAQDHGAFRMKLAAAEMARSYLSEDVLPILLFPPLTERPSWGMRQIGQEYLDKLGHAIFTEVSDWKSEVAYRSWSLLRLLLQLAEEHTTKLVVDVVKAMVTCIHRTTVARTTLPQAAWDCAALIGRYMHPERLAEVLVSKVADAHDSDRLVAALRLSAHALAFVPPKHEAREVALTHFVQRVLSDGAYLAHEAPIFHAYVALVSTLLQSPDLSLKWRVTHADSMFRVLLEVAAWSRLGHVQERTPEQQADLASLRRSIDAGYQRLLEQYDEEETDLMVLLQMRILPMLKEWGQQLQLDQLSAIPDDAAVAAAATSSAAVPASSTPTWQVDSLPFLMLLELLDKVAAASSLDDPDITQLFCCQQPDLVLFRTPIESFQPGRTGPIVAYMLECIVLALLQHAPPQLPVHAALLPPLASILASPRARFSSAFLRGVLDSCLSALPHFAAQLSASKESLDLMQPKGLRLPSREEQAKVAEAERAVRDSEARFQRYATAACDTVAALRAADKVAQINWQPSHGQVEALAQAMPPNVCGLLRPLLVARDDGSAAVDGAPLSLGTLLGRLPVH